jgi:hypothetical protein
MNWCGNDPRPRDVTGAADGLALKCAVCSLFRRSFIGLASSENTKGCKGLIV